jgi:Domain of unknown function (DUF4405)
MGRSASLNFRTYARAVIAFAMMVIWGLVTISGFLLWLAPHGPRSGFRLLLFDLTKREWGELHVWFSFIAIAITVAHLVVDWRELCGCMKYLASVHRHDSPANHEASSSSPAAAAT